MSGHSKFKTIMHRKGAQDAKRSRVFARLVREITVAAKQGGTEVESNPRLRTAIISAKAENMSKDNIEKAIKKADSTLDSDQLEEIRYEGFGSKGVAFIVECYSDNKNRTAADIRSFFKKSGGDLGANGSVTHQFDRVGVVAFEKGEHLTFDKLFEEALNAGANNIDETEELLEVYCSVDSFAQIRDTLMNKFGDPKFSGLVWVAKNPIVLKASEAEGIEKLEEMLDEYDAVQNLFTNYTTNKEI